MNGDDIAMLDPEVMADDTVDSGTSIVKIVIRQYNQDCIFALFASDQNSIAPEKLKTVHGVVGQRDDGVVIVYGIGDP